MLKKSNIKIIDISTEICEDMPIFPGDPQTRIIPHSSISMDHEANVSCLTIGTHSGTHIDPPLHFFNGMPGADNIPFDRLVGEALLLDLSHIKGPITEEDLQHGMKKDAKVKIILIKTKGQGKNDIAPPFLTESAASFLLSSGVRTVGIDRSSIEPDGGEYPIHRKLLYNNVLVIEGLDLSHVCEGTYFLICLPLKIKGGDGAPARAILIKNDE